jgi:hypothetical protein
MSWQRMRVLGFLAGISVLMQVDVATAQTLRTRPIPPKPSVPNPAQPVLDRIKITCDSARSEYALKLQQEIAAQFARQSLCPEARIKEFAWVTPKPEPVQISSGIYGWTGRIEKTTRTLDGWLVNVAVFPRLTNGATAIYYHNELYIENYEYTAGSLRFLNANEPPPGGRPRGMTWN